MTTKRLLTSAAVLAGIGTASGQLVDLDFTNEAVGAATSVTNVGTLGGVFENFGGGANDPQITQATIPVPQGFPAGTPGTAGLTLDGSDFLTHTDGAGTFINAPAGITGLDRTSSVEAWVLNPSIASEETVVAWGKRGGPGGTNASHNYGNHGAFGAIGHWGGADIGFNDAGGAPAAGEWHHIVWTYDGGTTRVYSDGVLLNSETLGAGAINTHGDTPITVGGQLAGPSVNQAPDFGDLVGGTLTVGKVRVHDGVLSDTDVANAFAAEAGQFVAPSGPAAATPATIDAPVNRYTFDLADVVGDGSNGTVVNDVIGGANGVVRGANGSVDGVQVLLPGGSGDTEAYIDLPNGLISTHGSGNGGSGATSIEFWATVSGARTWSRIFDIGSGTAGEIMGPGTAANGLDYVMVSAQVGTDTGARRVEIRNEDPAGGGIMTSDAATATLGTEVHGVLTLDEATGEFVYYENGDLATFGNLPAGFGLADLNDVNTWLGRSNWTGDQNLQGAYNEFRIYDYALNRDQVLGNFVAGPNVVNIPEPAALALIGLSGLALILRRRKA